MPTISPEGCGGTRPQRGVEGAVEGKVRSGLSYKIVIPIQLSVMGKNQSRASGTLTSGNEGPVGEACLERCVYGQR